jgi:hypothetical protein
MYIFYDTIARFDVVLILVEHHRRGRATTQEKRLYDATRNAHYFRTVQGVGNTVRLRDTVSVTCRTIAFDKAT